MKTLYNIILVCYTAGAAYLGYMAGMYLFVYFANRRLGHEESFSDPGKYLVGFILTTGFVWVCWRLLHHPSLAWIAKTLLLLPLAAVMLFIFYFAFLLISNGGRWN